MKIALPFIFIFYFNLLAGQVLKDSIKNSPRNQLDIGINFSYFFDGNLIRVDHSFEDPDLQERPYNALSALSFGYKRLISNKVFFLITRQQFDPGMDYFQHHSRPYSRGDLVWRAGYFNYGIGGGRYFKINNLQACLSLQLVYAKNEFEGYRSVFWKSPDKTSLGDGSFMQLLNYYDTYGFGVSPGVELNYFFCKKFGIGCNVNFNYFPLATSQPDREDSFDTDATPKEIKEYSQPDKMFLDINLKVVYRFRDPGFLR